MQSEFFWKKLNSFQIVFTYCVCVSEPKHQSLEMKFFDWLALAKNTL